MDLTRAYAFSYAQKERKWEVQGGLLFWVNRIMEEPQVRDLGMSHLSLQGKKEERTVAGASTNISPAPG